METATEAAEAATAVPDASEEAPAATAAVGPSPRLTAAGAGGGCLTTSAAAFRAFPCVREDLGVRPVWFRLVRCESEFKPVPVLGDHLAHRFTAGNRDPLFHPRDPCFVFERRGLPEIRAVFAGSGNSRPSTMSIQWAP